MSEVKKIIEQRASVHGEFETNADITWEFMAVAMRSPNWPTLPAGMRHSTYMILHKLSRALSGVAAFEDHWRDAEGYAKLVADRIVRPVSAHDGHTPVAALARAYGVSEEVARDRILPALLAGHSAKLAEAARTAASAPGRRTVLSGRERIGDDEQQGSPADGGHHGAAEETEYSDEERAEASAVVDRELSALEKTQY